MFGGEAENLHECVGGAERNPVEQSRRERHLTANSPASNDSSYTSDSGSREERSRSRSPRGVSESVETGPHTHKVGLGALVELTGLTKAAELNGRRAVITSVSETENRLEVLCLENAGSAGKAAEHRRLSITRERLVVVESEGAVRLRLRNVPSEYDTSLLREEFDEEGFVEGQTFSGLVFDASRSFAYLTASSERAAMQIIGNFDGRRLERCGPGRLMPDSVLARIVKVERL